MSIEEEIPDYRLPILSNKECLLLVACIEWMAGEIRCDESAQELGYANRTEIMNALDELKEKL